MTRCRRRPSTFVFAAILLAQLALITAVGATPTSAASTPSWLSRINQIRAGSGLPAVTTDAAWTAGIKDHLKYLAKTPTKYETGQYASAHTENPKSPYYTKAGALEGSHSDLAFGTTSDLAAINGWLAAPFHAIGMLRPGLTKVAFFRDPKTGDAGLDVISGDTFVAHTAPILYPGSGATINLTSYLGELPSPIETCTAHQPHGHYSSPGLPLIVLLSQSPTSDLSARLKKPNGSTVTSNGKNLCVVDENNFTSNDKVYAATGRSILAGDHAVLIIPRTRLVSGRYSVTVTQASQPDITWSFTCHPMAGSKHHVRTALRGLAM